jgi:hypothetical protein
LAEILVICRTGAEFEIDLKDFSGHGFSSYSDGDSFLTSCRSTNFRFRF